MVLGSWRLWRLLSYNFDHFWHRMSNIQINVVLVVVALCELTFGFIVARPAATVPWPLATVKCSKCWLQCRLRGVRDGRLVLPPEACEKERIVCAEFMVLAVIKSFARIKRSAFGSLYKDGTGQDLAPVQGAIKPQVQLLVNIFAQTNHKY